MAQEIAMRSSEDREPRSMEQPPRFISNERWERIKESLGKYFPSGYTHEFKALFAIAWQTILTSFFQFFLMTINIIMCGHLGKTDLDSVALASSLINVTGFSISTGLSTACDTLFSQTFGSVNKKRVGVYLQRCFLVLWMFLFPVWAIQANMQFILIAIGQDTEVAIRTALYMKWAMPGMFFHFTFVILARYMQNQNIVRAPMIIAFIGDLVSLGLHAIFIYAFTLPFWWSAIAMNLALVVMVVLEVVYLLVTKAYDDTWGGFTREAVFEWGAVVRLAIPGMLLLAMEEWSFEIGTLLSGLLGTTELGAQSIIFQFETIGFMIPLGMSIAVNIRVGQQLGMDRPTAAMTTPRVALTMIFCTATIVAIIYATFRTLLPRIFTDSEEVVQMAANVLPLLALFQYCDGLAATSNGAIRGCGRMALGASLVFVAYYVISLPLGCLFAFVAKIGVIGFWLGLIIGISIEAVIFFLIVVYTDWNEQARKALARAGLREHKKNRPKISQPGDEDARLLGNIEPTYKTIDSDSGTSSAGRPGSRRNALGSDESDQVVAIGALIGGIVRPGSRRGTTYSRHPSVVFEQENVPEHFHTWKAFWVTASTRIFTYFVAAMILFMACYMSACTLDPPGYHSPDGYGMGQNAPGFCFIVLQPSSAWEEENGNSSTTVAPIANVSSESFFQFYQSNFFAAR